MFIVCHLGVCVNGKWRSHFWEIHFEMSNLTVKIYFEITILLDKPDSVKVKYMFI